MSFVECGLAGGSVTVTKSKDGLQTNVLWHFLGGPGMQIRTATTNVHTTNSKGPNYTHAPSALSAEGS